MPERRRSQFQYAVIRLVPDLVRGECLNVGVVLLSRPRRYLGARTRLDAARLAAFAPSAAPDEIVPHLEAIERIAAGDPDGGPIAGLTLAERYHWLVAPSSTILQPGPAHTGICRDPETELEHLFATLVG